MFKLRLKKIKSPNIYLNKYFIYLNNTEMIYKIVDIDEENLHFTGVWIEQYNEGKIEVSSRLELKYLDEKTYILISDNDVKIPEKLKNYVYDKTNKEK